jgi:hypothetical protein
METLITNLTFGTLLNYAFHIFIIMVLVYFFALIVMGLNGYFDKSWKSRYTSKQRDNKMFKLK